jgi:hypothetical protein
MERPQNRSAMQNYSRTVFFKVSSSSGGHLTHGNIIPPQVNTSKSNYLDDARSGQSRNNAIQSAAAASQYLKEARQMRKNLKS